MENDGLIKLSDVNDIATEFYKTCIDYLDQWSGDLEELVNVQWALLKEALPRSVVRRLRRIS